MFSKSINQIIKQKQHKYLKFANFFMTIFKNKRSSEDIKSNTLRNSNYKEI